MVQTTSVTTVYVNSVSGNDAAKGTQAAPYRTVTKALTQTTGNVVIQLAKGIYSQSSGEVFPLVVKGRVTIVGDENNQGRDILIEGSGNYSSSFSGVQAITLCLADQAQLLGVMVINPSNRGIAIWVEAGTPTIAHSTITQTGQAGVWVTGTAKPLISSNQFSQDGGTGLVLQRNAKGEVRGNLFRQTLVGIAVGDDAAPLIVDNQFEDHRSGLVLTQRARPVLRNNRIEQNTEDGLVLRDSALPDLGVLFDPGDNRFQNNQRFDVSNSTTAQLVAVGNQINPAKVQGNVALRDRSSAINPGGIQFTDTKGHWAEAFIAGLVKRNILRGFPDGTFRPEVPLTRAQFAAAVVTTFQLPDRRSSRTFVDVTPGFWAVEVIQKVDRMGFLSGFPDGTFRPSQNLTRVQAIVALISGLGWTGGSPVDLGVYRDRAAIPSYANDRIATATQRRVIVNYPHLDYLEPMREITRAEVSAILYQTLVAQGSAQAVASSFIVSPMGKPTTFTDLQGHWASEFISALASQNLISGFPDGTFQPEAGITRAQYTALLVNAFNPASKRPATTFADVPANFWAAKVIQQAYRGGFIAGFTDQTFRPDWPVQRVQVLASLVYGLGLPAADLKLLDRYTDQNNIPAYAKSQVASATQAKLVINQPVLQYLNPTLASTRAEVAATIYQGLVRVGRMPAIPSPFIVNNLPA